MARPLSVLLLVAATLTLASALSCEPCTEELIAQCKPSEPSVLQCLPRGRQTLPCACCKSCRNGLNEPCGGLWGLLGKCAVYLYCKLNAEQPPGTTEEHMEGTCSLMLPLPKI